MTVAGSVYILQVIVLCAVIALICNEKDVF